MSTPPMIRLRHSDFNMGILRTLMSDCFICCLLIASVSIDNNYNVSLIILIFSDTVILWFDGVVLCVRLRRAQHLPLQ